MGLAVSCQRGGCCVGVGCVCSGISKSALMLLEGTSSACQGNVFGRVCQSWHGQSKPWGENSKVSSSWPWQQLQYLWATLQGSDILQAVSHPTGEEQSPGQGWMAAPLAMRGSALLLSVPFREGSGLGLKGAAREPHTCLQKDMGVQWALSPPPSHPASPERPG